MKHSWENIDRYSPQKRQLVKELHVPAKENFERRKVILGGVDDLWQIDLIVMIPHAKVNRNSKSLLAVVDVFSKYAWLVPVSKSGSDVTKAFEISLRNIPSPPRV